MREFSSEGGPSDVIEPHGGRLVQRALGAEEAERVAAGGLPRISVSAELAQDLRNIGTGVYSPLEGPLGAADFAGIMASDRLRSGVVWTFPIVLDVTAAEAECLSEGAEVAVYEARPQGERLAAVLHLQEKYGFDKQAFVRTVFGTEDESHPGVARTMARGDVLLAGPVDPVPYADARFAGYDLTPAQTRETFAARGWRSVVAFQTRNVPHLGHEDLQKTVLGLCDGLLIHPLVGRKKSGDFRDEVILAAYQALLDGYYCKDRVLLSVLPTEMRYAGPKEAVHHAIMRKNHGCTHIIIGRDHAGVGRFYAPEAAIEMFAAFPDLGIQPIMIRGDFFYCRKCRRIESDRTCNHDRQYRIDFSGTEIRQMLKAGTSPPPEIMRPEVFAVLQAAPNPFVD
jgi:sulfate adenylyltransferase